MSKLAEIRFLYETKVNKIDPHPIFDSRDLSKVTSDIYLYRVLEHCQNNVQQAADMLYNIMEWRKTNNVNDICEANVDLDILKDGLYFTRGRDIDSCLLFIMNSKAYIKNQKDLEAVKKVFIYWLERLERKEGGKKVTLFFDMDGCGINNMNLNLFSYMINVLKCYYPNFINYVIIFQMPWVLSAGFGIVKKMLPAPAIERLRVINKDNLKDLIAPEQALVSWGGKDNYKFEFVPEHRKIGPVIVDNDDNYSLGEMLRLKPPKVLLFETINHKISSQLIITNMEEGITAFKIRTTAPERYTVRPNQGILPKHISKSIDIVVLPGFHLGSVEKDRFLILSVNVPKLDMPQTELRQIWKSAGNSIDEYRLTCAVKEQNVNVKNVETNSFNEINRSMENKYKTIQNNLNSFNKYQIVIMIIMSVSIFINIIIWMNIGRKCTRL
ncbi:motile sperm domain-containing protein 2 [Pieris rapae]|uniref:motile sperm domain-containing protein 2 n=1 Tax=Pieris rapae TaxID=64459 RepID=UPI001E2807EC|nr:motile sperm domain-containing protein 2 [Pieris rapae]